MNIIRAYSQPAGGAGVQGPPLQLQGPGKGNGARASPPAPAHRERPRKRAQNRPGRANGEKAGDNPIPGPLSALSSLLPDPLTVQGVTVHSKAKPDSLHQIGIEREPSSSGRPFDNLPRSSGEIRLYFVIVGSSVFCYRLIRCFTHLITLLYCIPWHIPAQLVKLTEKSKINL